MGGLSSWSIHDPSGRGREGRNILEMNERPSWTKGHPLPSSWLRIEQNGSNNNDPEAPQSPLDWGSFTNYVTPKEEGVCEDVT